MSRVVISGYYGFGNTGDEIMLMAMVKALKCALGDVEVTVLSHNPRETREAHGVGAVSRTDVLAIRRAILWSDLFISGGGSLLQDATGPKSIPYYLGLALWARFLGKPVVLYGQGMGPVRSRFSRMLMRCLTYVDLVCLRDADSADLLEGLGITLKNLHITADPVLFLGRGSREEGRLFLRSQGIDADKPIIGVFPRPWKGRRGYESILGKAARHLASHSGGQVVLMPLQPSQDSDIVREMASSEEGAAFKVVRLHYRNMPDAIAAMDMVLSVRLHGTVLAALSGVPTVALSYDPKIDAFTRVLGLKTLGISDLSLEDLMLTAEHTWARREEISRSLLAADEDLRERSYMNARLTAELLENTRRPVVLGHSFDPVDVEGALERAVDMIEGGGSHLVVTANPETLYVARGEPRLKEAMERAGMVLADGAGIVWASSFLGRALPGKVPGIELVEGLLAMAAKRGWPVFLLGTREEVVAKAARNLARMHPGLKIAGHHHGFFAPSEEEQVVDLVKNSGARILLVALGVPRQEKFLLEHLEATGASLGIGIGGTLDVFAGKVKRAPAWVRSLNLEWLYRLLKNPKRWRRQLSIPWFVMATFRYKFSLRREAGK